MLLVDGVDFRRADLALIITGAVITLLAYTVSKVAYNLWLHPLRAYPGPWLARATTTYIDLLEIKGNLHLKTKEWHDRYGDVVRTAPNRLSYSTGQAWNEICGHRSNTQKSVFDKDPNFYIAAPNGYFSVLSSNGEQHRRLRRLLAHAFSDKSLRLQETCLQGYVDLLISQLKKRAATDDGVVDMVHWFNFATFDIIGDLAFGDSFSLLKGGVWNRYLSSIFGVLQFNAYKRLARTLIPWPWKAYLAEKMTPQTMRADAYYQDQLSREKLRRRIALETERHDFVYHMLKGSEEALGPEGLTFEEMVAQGRIFILAGSETTATLLSGMLYYLLKNPSILARLVDEIRTSFSSEAEIDIQSVSHLSYLHAVIEESLRIYPPVPNALPRVAPPEGAVICGRFVPEGTSIGLHQWTCHHSEKNFFEPDTFHPERWLDNNDPRFINDDKDAFHPFSHGPRNCLGKNLAYAELRLIVSKFFWNFDVELQPGCENWAKQKANTLWIKKPLNVKLLPRKGA